MTDLQWIVVGLIVLCFVFMAVGLGSDDGIMR